MKKISMISCLAAVLLSCLGLSFGSDLISGDDSADDSTDELSWYTAEVPAVIGGLIDKGLLPEGEEGMGPEDMGPEEGVGLWIVDQSEEEKYQSLAMPTGVWAKLLLMPSASGELKLYCRYPTGTVDLLLEGDVEEGHSYIAWYHTEAEGNYDVWYSLNGSNSSTVSFIVEGSYEPEYSTPTPSVSKSMTGLTGGGAPTVMYEAAPPMTGAMPSSDIGFATGGAKDIGNFRQNIEEGFLPLPTDLTYEGLFYDYYFETGEAQECTKLFCPSYSRAISKDPFSGKPEHYLSVGLNSGISTFERKKLNLVVVLDYSGSMDSQFNEYYYDLFGNLVEPEVTEDSGKTKMEIADQAVVDLLDHLKDDDRFGMVIFSDEAFIVEPLTPVADKNMDGLKERILEIESYSGTNMEAGMVKGTAQLSRYLDSDPAEYENRIIFLTDAMPNIGETEEGGLQKILADNSERRIYTTFIGIGVDFNTELIEAITKIQGANYYSVHSASEFKERMDDEFDFMVTPLVFDLLLDLDATGYKIEKVYGSPEADEATGEIMKVNTLFPSKAVEGEVKGGMVLIKLTKLSEDSSLALRVSYKDRNGVPDSDEALVEFKDIEPDFYDNNGIRKAVLLTRYADLLKDWTMDERMALLAGGEVVPTITLESGIVIPVILGEWERQSMPLQVSSPYRKLFGIFGTYFEDERLAIGDMNLQQEEAVLNKLAGFGETEAAT